MNTAPTLQNPAAPPAAGATAEMESLLGDIRSSWSSVSALPGEVKTIRDSSERLATDLKDLRRIVASRNAMVADRQARRTGQVSDACARHVASTFIIHCERSDKLD